LWLPTLLPLFFTFGVFGNDKGGPAFSGPDVIQGRIEAATFDLAKEIIFK
jgi:ascorbate-specific PTS system EIIC-type component UlaA